MGKITFDKLKKTIIILIALLIVWFFLLSQYMGEITGLIGPIGIMIIFLILIFSLGYCHYLWFGGGNPLNLPKWFKKWKKGSKKRKRYDIIFFLILLFCMPLTSYIDVFILKDYSYYSIALLTVIFPLVIIYSYFRPTK